MMATTPAAALAALCLSLCVAAAAAGPTVFTVDTTPAHSNIYAAFSGKSNVRHLAADPYSNGGRLWVVHDTETTLGLVCSSIGSPHTGCAAPLTWSTITPNNPPDCLMLAESKANTVSSVVTKEGGQLWSWVTPSKIQHQWIEPPTSMNVCELMITISAGGTPTVYVLAGTNDSDVLGFYAGQYYYGAQKIPWVYSTTNHNEFTVTGTWGSPVAVSFYGTVSPHHVAYAFQYGIAEVNITSALLFSSKQHIQWSASHYILDAKIGDHTGAYVCAGTGSQLLIEFLDFRTGLVSTLHAVANASPTFCSLAVATANIGATEVDCGSNVIVVRCVVGVTCLQLCGLDHGLGNTPRTHQWLQS
eukprot:TRINITY_DN410_c0_g2_i1.p1 TRINITY_DN410_c0_g2~~TRINITY_DN410_c0_g2_i1.p1  ORF type:complete len:359 (+),score=62.85 TRINITY_DN410_c0_g2_i1:95-1171(+)